MKSNKILCKICSAPLEYSHTIRTPTETLAIYLCPFRYSVGHDNDNEASGYMQ